MNKDNDIQDILDLCRLNLMEKNVSQTDYNDTETTLKAIAWKKRNLAQKLSNQGLSFSEEQIKKHRKEFTTEDGRYPPQQDDLFMIEEELKE